MRSRERNLVNLSIPVKAVSYTHLELLKDKDIETNEQGRRLLEQYGYWGNKGNAFYSQFRHQVMVTGAVSTVTCVLLLTFLLYWKKKEDAVSYTHLDVYKRQFLTWEDIKNHKWHFKKYRMQSRGGNY